MRFELRRLASRPGSGRLCNNFKHLCLDRYGSAAFLILMDSPYTDLPVRPK
jgi:hypothetical protein